MADTTPDSVTGGLWSAPVPTLSRLLDADRTAVVVVEPDGRVESLNAAMLTLLGAQRAADIAPGAPAHAELVAFLDQLPRSLRHGGTGTWSGDVDHARRGDARVLRATAHAMPSADGTPRIALLLHDVSEARRHLSALRRRATHDALTGFVNRHRLLADLTEAIGRARSTGDPVAVVSIDIDHLKHVNDALGTEAGDRLLSSTGQRLEQVLRPDDRVARVGGDEFLVMCQDVRDPASALELAERIERALRGTAAVDELSIEVAASVGVALHEPLGRPDRDDAAGAATLVGDAEAAMGDAKRLGGARAVLYRHAGGATFSDRSDLAISLSDALARHAITVDYQPVFSLVGRHAVGVEALARWHHPTRGVIDPSTFITVAEEIGLIGRLGAEILEMAMSDLRSWIEAGVVGQEFALHVNVSTAQLASPLFAELVLDAARRHRLDPRQVVLEARETSLVTRPADVDRSIRTLRRAGFNVALDDFGVGTQALALLTGLGTDVVKLDGSLALPPGSTDEQARLVRAIVLLAHALDISVIAERVDSLDQLERLAAVGCDMAQGNLLGRPCRADELELAGTAAW